MLFAGQFLALLVTFAACQLAWCWYWRGLDSISVTTVTRRPMAAEEGHHDTGSYVLHHLTNLRLDLQSMTILTGDDPRGAGFWVLNLDSCIFSVLLGVIFAGLFWHVARKASAAHPTQGPNLNEQTEES